MRETLAEFNPTAPFGRKSALLLVSAALMLTTAVPSLAENQPGVDTGDTAFIFICSALVMLMTPGLALFYGGMVRRKNVLGTIMHSFVAVALMSVVWVLWGYSLAFGPDLGSFVGSLKWLGLNGVGPEPSDYAGTIPHYLFMMFQMMFAIITPALISGALAERIKFSTHLVFLALWSTLVYSVICHWVWGGGWLGNLGALDFAGGTVVHISSGVSGLVGITPAAGFVTPGGAILIGLSVALICFYAVSLKEKLGCDDSLDAFGIHGVGGTWGALATGLLATTAVNEAGANGLFYGNPAQFGVQLVGVLATAAYAALVTFVLLKILDKTMGLRVPEDHESMGLDISQHDERGDVL